ncbi:threonine synthase [Geminicoccus flavidas]|uniref:threonine synthase n=1 Tax=Geminicoccus flavidas TaxID=2506407 RepID=UPI0013573A3D|nr:threonine synthase [Geminicoccus flavidas]
MVAYISTRGGAGVRPFEEVLLAGLAEDGGLFLPSAMPKLTPDQFAGLTGRPYAETAEAVLWPFVEGTVGRAEFRVMVAKTYAGFSHAATAPLVQIGDDDWLLELFHGPTLAFKDFALQLLGRLFEHVLRRRGETITIVGATSGDTGSAALAACAGRANMRIVILHPKGRVSEVQRRQMTTVLADNVVNIAVEGTFDDCQALVKRMFNDQAFREAHRLAAINSINWFRLAAQAVYYVHATLRLGGLARPVAFAVPTGNFGDVYAGTIAKAMGLPVAGLVAATNSNDIVARFLLTGRYAKGNVMPTTSPSMDIQVASNFERLLFELEDREPARLVRQMERFAAEGALEVEPERLKKAQGLITGHAVDEAAVQGTIRRVYRHTGIVIDPHTAVGVAAARAALPEGAARVTLATAHPAKFPDAVEAAIGRRPVLPESMAGLFEREERYHVLPAELGIIQDHIRKTA